jgi:hypothetical protein
VKEYVLVMVIRRQRQRKEGARVSISLSREYLKDPTFFYKVAHSKGSNTLNAWPLREHLKSKPKQWVSLQL